MEKKEWDAEFFLQAVHVPHSTIFRAPEQFAKNGSQCSIAHELRLRTIFAQVVHIMKKGSGYRQEADSILCLVNMLLLHFMHCNSLMLNNPEQLNKYRLCIYEIMFSCVFLKGSQICF